MGVVLIYAFLRCRDPALIGMGLKNCHHHRGPSFDNSLWRQLLCMRGPDGGSLSNGVYMVFVVRTELRVLSLSLSLSLLVEKGEWSHHQSLGFSKV